MPIIHLLLTCVILVDLPFVYAGTVPIGFPLKVCEPAAALLIFLIIVQLVAVKRIPLAYAPPEKRLLVVAGFFFVACCVSSFIGCITLANTHSSVHLMSWRDNPGLASVLKCGYVVLDIFFFAYLLGYKKISAGFICNLWLVGAFLSALYGWYLFLASWRGMDPPRLPGNEEVQTTGFLFPGAIRGGSFREGNHASLFYLLSACVAAVQFAVKPRLIPALLVLFFIASLVPTQSTIGLLAAGACVGTFVVFKLARSRNWLLIIPLGLFLAGAAWGFSRTDIFQKVIVDKLEQENPYDFSGSLSQRRDLIYAGWKMFRSSPVLGVGLSNFGYLYPYYTHYAPEEIGFDPAEKKNIANCVYVELLSETGLLGVLVFGCFILGLTCRVMTQARTAAAGLAFSGLVSIYFAWLAYPTYTMLYEWVFMALALRIAVDSKPFPKS